MRQSQPRPIITSKNSALTRVPNPTYPVPTTSKFSTLPGLGSSSSYTGPPFTITDTFVPIRMTIPQPNTSILSTSLNPQDVILGAAQVMFSQFQSQLA
ncbi:conserved hypothetical protein [Ricinus communis]|uniref:Uncharacterized protein n=1 Tax=Ricinus communis TaxID=3988 RepID=B9SNK2_RICCO|nr:conserved hypothetical protein [Ricinus communis]